MSHLFDGSNVKDVIDGVVAAIHRDLADAYIKGLRRAADIAESETDGDNRPWDNAILTVVEMIEKEIAQWKA